MPELMPVPEASKPQLAQILLENGTPEQREQVMAWLKGKFDAKAFFCERRHQCRWQGFRLHQGLGWGKIPDPNDPWMVWHTKECGGKLIELFEKADSPVVVRAILSDEAKEPIIPTTAKGESES